ncbi:hypothetical protein OK074_6007 [Actinobacteria bacterium OK074]|nr:hypothetical protein OK074_6007 [Actinobacteria bacterium OK074]
MARSTSSQNQNQARALVALASVGAALAAGAAAAAPASAAEAAPVVDVMRSRNLGPGNIDPQAGLAALTNSVQYVTGPVAGLKPNPLAGTGVDPLDNGVGTQLADFKPLTSQALTGPVAQASSLGAVPVVGQVLGGLGH